MIWCSPALALDLTEARDRASRLAAEVELASARAEVARAEAGQALAPLVPSVVGFVDGSVGGGFTAFGFERPLAVQLGLGAEASWALLAPSSWAGAAAARRRSTGAAALAQWARMAARRDATRAYALAWAAQEELASWTTALQDAARLTQAARSRAAAGLLAPHEVARAEAEEARLQASWVQAGAERAVRCAELNALTATDDCDLQLPPLPAIGTAEGEHPALVAAKAAFEAAEAERGAASWDLGPAVQLRGTLAEYLVVDQLRPGWSVGARAEIPLGDLDRWRGAAVARAAVDEAAAGLLAQERALEVATRSAEVRLEAAQAALTAWRTAEAAASQALLSADQRGEAGLLGLSDWLLTRRERDQSRIERIRAEAALAIATAELVWARAAVWGTERP